MRKLNWATIVLDLIYILLGVVFIIRPEGVESVLCYILAAAVAVIGLIYLAGYFVQRADESGQRQGNGFVFGIMLIIMSVFIVVKQPLVISLVPFLFGVMVMIRGLMVIQSMFIMRRMGFPILVPLVSGLLTMAMGIFVMLFPFETATMLFVLIGIGLMVGGVTGIIQEIMMWHQARSQAHAKERAKDMEGWKVEEEDEEPAEAAEEASVRAIPEPAEEPAPRTLPETEAVGDAEPETVSEETTDTVAEPETDR